MLRSGDGMRISLCLASVKTGMDASQELLGLYSIFSGPFLLSFAYFYGTSYLVSNASSLPPLLPFLSQVLRMLGERPLEDNRRVLYKVICCSYRRYWNSKARPSEKGIAQDATATLEWIKSAHERQIPWRSNDQRIPVVI